MELLEYTNRWDPRRLGSLFQEQKEKNTQFTRKNALKFTYGSIVDKPEYDMTPSLVDTYSKYTLVDEGDIVINCLNLNYDFVSQRVAIVKNDGIITSAYISLRARSSDINPMYYCYYFKAMDARKMFHGMGTGIRLTLSYNELRNVPIPVPPRAEQDQIVRFLDWKVSEINKLIGIRRKEIQELEELKDNIIFHATTSGLNKNVPMKNTGNYWIGTIPEHWEVVQVRRAYSVILGKMLATKPSDSSDTYEEYVCAKDVHFDGVDLSDLKQMWFSTSEKKQYKIEANDLLIVEGGAGAGNAALVEGPLDHDIFVQNSIHIVRPKSNLCITQFLAYWMRSMVKRDYMKFVCSVATIPHYTKDKVMSTVMPLPPVNEQKDIVSYLDNECEKIDNLINKRHSQIETLQELKNSLISDVVTGKIDVRNIVVPEFEHVDDIADDDSEDGEETDQTETDGEEA